MKKMTKIKKFLTATIICLTLAFSGLALSIFSKSSDVYALAPEVSTITNKDFEASSSTGLQTSPSGWSKADGSDAVDAAGVIAIGDTFDSNLSDYKLESTENPGTHITSTSNKHVLMINAEDGTKKYGFKSSSISLSASSTYVISIYAKTQDSTLFSLYLNGILDEDEQFDSSNSFVSVTTSGVWKKHYFFVRTGSSSKTITLEAWLGSKSDRSGNAVFFDDLNCEKYSEKDYMNLYSSVDADNRLMIDKQNNFLDNSSLFTNPSFEYYGNDFQATVGANGSILPISSNPEFDNYDFVNDKVFVINNQTETASEYTAKNILINKYGFYQISIDAKIVGTLEGSGSLSISLNERESDDESLKDVVDLFPNYELQNITFDAIKTSATNTQRNNFNRYYFLVKGNGIVDSVFDLKLTLGTSSSTVKGMAIFDNLKIESLTNDEFSEISTGSFVKKTTLTVETTTPAVPNGYFSNHANENPVDDTGLTSFPVLPSDWTFSNENGRDTATETIRGIVNTNDSLFPETEAGISNPGNPYSYSPTSSTSNNILMLYNKVESFQSAISKNISIPAIAEETAGTKNLYELSFFAKTSLSTGKLTAKLFEGDPSSDGVLVSKIENISNTSWNKYSFFVRTNTEKTNFVIVFENGNSSSKSQGHVFIDNVKRTSVSKTISEYTSLVNSTSDKTKILDYIDGLLSITTSDISINNVYDSYEFASTTENGNYAGVAPGKGNAFGVSSAGEKLFDSILVISNDSIGTTKLSKNTAISLEKGSYYKITVDVLTKNITAPATDLDSLSYGVKIELSGISKTFKKVVSDNTWTSYTFYISATNSLSSNLTLSFESDVLERTGMAFFDNLKVSTITSTTFEESTSNISNTPNVLKVGEIIPETDSSNEETTTEGDDSSTNKEIWLWIPTGLLALVTIAALVAFALRHVKVKKYAQKTTNTYDRSTSLDRDQAKREAKAKFEKQIAELKKEIAVVEKDEKSVESSYQEKLANFRETQKSSPEKAKAMNIEKEYKNYGKERLKLSNKKTNLEEKIKSLENPENLIIEETKILAIKERERKRVLYNEKKIALANEKKKKKAKR